MHRKRTHVARRIGRIGTKLEHRGIVATYEFHDRLGANAVARRRFDKREPVLDSVQRRIVDEVRDSGFSVLAFSDLFPNPTQWAELDASASAFIAHVEEGLAREAAGLPAPDLSRRPGKEFVIRRYPYGTALGLDDPWLRLASDRRLLDIANAYHRMLSKLEYVDLWYTPPVPAETGRRVSQNWHRDFNDRHLLKVFVYLVDVDEGTGPFEYIPGTEPGGSVGDVWPWRPLGRNYPPVEAFEQWAAGLTIKTFTGPKGTILFCNTAGFHRGGFATRTARVLATFTYDSAAALKALSERNFTFRARNGDAGDAVVRYALT